MTDFTATETRVSTAGFELGAGGVTPPSNPNRRGVFLADVVVELGLADQETIDHAQQAAQETERSLERYLLEAGILDEDSLSRAIAERNSLDHVDLGEFEVDMDAAQMVARSAAERYRAVPVSFASDGALIVAVQDPFDTLGTSDIEVMTRSAVRPAIATAGGIDALIERLPEQPVQRLRVESPATEKVAGNVSVGPPPSANEDISAEAVERANGDGYFFDAPGPTESIVEEVELPVEEPQPEATKPFQPEEFQPEVSQVEAFQAEEPVEAVEPRVEPFQAEEPEPREFKPEEPAAEAEAFQAEEPVEAVEPRVEPFHIEEHKPEEFTPEEFKPEEPEAGAEEFTPDEFKPEEPQAEAEEFQPEEENKPEPELAEQEPAVADEAEAEAVEPESVEEPEFELVHFPEPEAVEPDPEPEAVVDLKPELLHLPEPNSGGTSDLESELGSLQETARRADELAATVERRISELKSGSDERVASLEDDLAAAQRRVEELEAQASGVDTLAEELRATTAKLEEVNRVLEGSVR